MTGLSQEAPAVRAQDATDVVGRRIGAALIDILITGIAFVVIGIVSGGGHAGHGHAGVTLGGTATAVFVIGALAYFFICEATWGQTVGKRLLGVRVVGIDGRAPDAGRALLRTLLRIVDALPALYLVGLASVLATAADQRIGDIAAGTTVRRA